MPVYGAIDRVGEQRPTWAASAAADGSGNAIFLFPSGLFASVPSLTVGIIASDGAVYFHKITALSAAGATVHVDRSASVTVLGIGVLAVQTNASSVGVNIIASANA